MKQLQRAGVVALWGAALLACLLADAQTARFDFVPQAPILVVSKSGRVREFRPTADTDAARGTALQAAANALVADDQLIIGSGTYALGAATFRSSQFPARVQVRGAGRLSTIITTTGTSALGVLWEPGDDNHVSHLQFYGTLLTSSSQLPFGCDTNTADAATGVMLVNVYFRADSDCLYFSHATGAMELKAYDSIFESRYDTIFPAGAAHQLTFYDCISGADATGSGANAADLIRSLRIAAGTTTFVGGRITANMTSAHPGNEFLAECYGASVANGATLNLRSTELVLTSGVGDGTIAGVFNAGTTHLDGVTVSVTSTASAGYCLANQNGTLNANSGRLIHSGAAGHLQRTGGTLNVGPGLDWSTSSGTITRLPALGVTPGAGGLASLAATSSTGSGAVVFGTSPALSTPSLGVASASSLTMAGGTVTSSTPLLTQTQTFSSGGTTFVAGSTSITDTASAAGSVAYGWYIGGSEAVAIRKGNGSGWGLMLNDGVHLRGAANILTVQSINNGDWKYVQASGFECINGFLKIPSTSELTIASDAVTATRSFHRVDTQADAATDDLSTISGGSEGRTLTLRAENTARTVVVKDGLGNIRCAGDFSLDSTEDLITLIHDGTNWVELARADNGT